MSSTASHFAIAEDSAETQAATASSRQIAGDTAYYLTNIGKVTTIRDFVGNTRLFSYAMKAYDLADMDYAKGLMTQVLQGGLTDATALATALNDPRYKAFATTFDFTGKGSAVTQSMAATTGTIARYLERSHDDIDRLLSDRLAGQAGTIAFVPPGSTTSIPQSLSLQSGD